jgi:hypothetical protein
MRLSFVRTDSNDLTTGSPLLLVYTTTTATSIGHNYYCRCMNSVVIVTAPKFPATIVDLSVHTAHKF